jgi:hypothetical protein
LMPRIRFRLRTALVLMVCVCIPLGFLAAYIRRVRLQQIAVAELQWRGYAAVYDNRLDQGKGSELGLLRSLLGRHAVDSVVEVRLAIMPSLLGDNTLEKARPSLERLPHLRTLDLSYSTISDTGLQALASLPQLETLRLVNCKYVALEDACWLAQTPNLLHLDLRQTQIDDDAIPCLAQLLKLEELEVGKTPMTDTGVTKLRSLMNVRCSVRDK